MNAASAVAVFAASSSVVSGTVLLGSGADVPVRLCYVHWTGHRGSVNADGRSPASISNIGTLPVQSGGAVTLNNVTTASAIAASAVIRLPRVSHYCSRREIVPVSFTTGCHCSTLTEQLQRTAGTPAITTLTVGRSCNAGAESACHAGNLDLALCLCPGLCQSTRR